MDMDFSLTFTNAAVLAAIVGTSYFIARFFYGIIRSIRSPIRRLPGPPSSSFIWGNLREIFKADPGQLQLQWSYEYGPTFTYKGFLKRNRLVTLDPKALTYVLNHSYDFPKPPALRDNLAELLGEGVLFAEGDAHKRQRRVMNPSFARPYIRELTDIFHEKSLQLRDILSIEVARSGGTLVTNMCPWLSRVTLDIIGLAGFGYKFDALNPSGEVNELSAAFSNAMKEGGRSRLLNVLRNFIPILRKIPTQRTRSMAKSSEVMTRIGFELVRTKKQALLSAISSKESVAGQLEKNDISGRDLLSRLLAANMASDLPDNQRLSDQDVFGQISTFLVAGHETTATGATWALYALAQNHAVQNKLREELLLVETETPSMDELNALPYLEFVVRETMRLHAPVPGTVRISAKDDLIPCETPFQDRNGILRHEIPIMKGDSIVIPILPLNLHRSIWGDDALEFRPERWESHSEKNHNLPGVYANMLTFIGGPRACIGYRFALIELKAILFALLRSFQFELAVPPEDIVKKSELVTRPFLKKALKDGPTLPLKITAWKSV